MINSTNLKSILLLAANPKKTPNLRLQEEEREIRERLRMAGYGKVPIHSTGATRYRDIQQAMVDFNPQIVHFSGHGAGEDGLVFEDAVGQEALVSSEALANLFRIFSTEGLECVVLNACHTKFQAEAIAKHVDYVIGTIQSIKNTEAIEFAVGFYTGVGAGKTIDFAFELGRNAVELARIRNQPMPIFYLYRQGELIAKTDGINVKQENNVQESEAQISMSETERIVLQFVNKSRQKGTHPTRKQEVKIALNTYSEDEIERAIDYLLTRRELRESLAGELSISHAGSLRLRENNKTSDAGLSTPINKENNGTHDAGLLTPKNRAFMLLKKIPYTKFREVIFSYDIPESYISTNRTQVEQAIEIINYATEKEGEFLEKFLKLIS